MLAVVVERGLSIFGFGVVFLFPGEEGDKEESRNEDVHPDRVEIAHPATGNIFPGKEAGAEDQVFYRDEELGIEMGDVFEEMADDMADAFFWFEVLLATVCTK